MTKKNYKGKITGSANYLLGLLFGNDSFVGYISNIEVGIPEVTEFVKLSSPVIYFDYKSEGGEGGGTPPVGENTTSAVLGQAILGFAILGNDSFSENIVRLEAPVIYFADEESNEPDYDFVKLAAPVIRITETEGEDGDDTDSPIVVKLEAPVVYIEKQEDGEQEPEPPEEPEHPQEPIIVKLGAPVIWFVGEQEPEEPIVVKLGVPVAHLEFT